MRFAVIADTHLGHPESDDSFIDKIHNLRKEGYQIIWLGDIFEEWSGIRGSQRYEKLILKPGDIYLTGNHDHQYKPPHYVEHHSRFFQYKNFLFTHGDLLDIPYLVALAKQKKIFFGNLRRWNGGEYWEIYDALSSIPLETLNRLSGRKPIVKDYWEIFKVFLKSLFSYGDNVDVYDNLVVGPLYPKDPQIIFNRISSFYPNRNFDALIIGHIHRHIDVKIEENKRLIVLDCWFKSGQKNILLIENDGTTNILFH